MIDGRDVRHMKGKRAWEVSDQIGWRVHAQSQSEVADQIGQRASARVRVEFRGRTVECEMMDIRG